MSRCRRYHPVWLTHAQMGDVIAILKRHQEEGSYWGNRKQFETRLGDSIEIEQVVVNLVRNGVEAMDGEESSARKLSITTTLTNDRTVQVAIRDHGHGFHCKDMEQLFEPFFSTKREGMGIGLSISRSIVESHGGRLWAESNTDSGMTFIFTLPVEMEE